MATDLPSCPNCAGTLEHAAAISALVIRSNIRMLSCTKCFQVHWFAFDTHGAHELGASPFGLA
jgi:hypothetical protein